MRLRLAAAGILTAAELHELRSALDTIAAEFAYRAKARTQCAIIRLRKIFITLSSCRWWSGSARWGCKLHTGRSRNEQIATDLRLYVREQIELVVESLGSMGRGAARTGAARRRCGDAELHASAAGRAGAGCALAAGLCGDDSARCDAAAGLCSAAELLSAGFGSGCRRDARARSDYCRAGAGIHCSDRKLDGCDQRSRFHSRVSAGADIRRLASEPLC